MANNSLRVLTPRINPSPIVINDSVSSPTVIINNVGPKGDTGATPSAISYTANGTVNGHRVVKLSGGSLVTLADSVSTNDAQHILGISNNTALDGETVTITTFGELVEPTWTWTANQIIYCGTNGTLTTTPPTSGVCIIVATALSATIIFVKIQTPIIIS